jgi:hypothetical protein
VDPEKASIARQQPVNTFPWQLKHDPASTTPGPSLSNSLLNTSFNNGRILGSGVFCVVRTDAV